MYRQWKKYLPMLFMLLPHCIKRVYNLIIPQWIDHMNYLRINYPYLYRLAIRTIPFDQKASVIVK